MFLKKESEGDKRGTKENNTGAKADTCSKTIVLRQAQRVPERETAKELATCPTLEHRSSRRKPRPAPAWNVHKSRRTGTKEHNWTEGASGYPREAA